LALEEAAEQPEILTALQVVIRCLVPLLLLAVDMAHGLHILAERSVLFRAEPVVLVEAAQAPLLVAQETLQALLRRKAITAAVLITLHRTMVPAVVAARLQLVRRAPQQPAVMGETEPHLAFLVLP